MTEQEWFRCCDPDLMLDALADQWLRRLAVQFGLPCGRGRRRGLQRFVSACFAHATAVFSVQLNHVVAGGPRVTVQPISPSALQRELGVAVPDRIRPELWAKGWARNVAKWLAWRTWYDARVAGRDKAAAWRSYGAALARERRAQCDLLRDILRPCRSCRCTMR